MMKDVYEVYPNFTRVSFKYKNILENINRKITEDSLNEIQKKNQGTL